MLHASIAGLSAVLLWLSIVLLVVTAGCGTGGKEDDTESTSSASTEVTQCGDVTFEIPEEALPAFIEEQEAEGNEVLVPDFEEPTDGGGLDQQTRLLKVIVVGCGNTVVNEDNDSVSDDDVNTETSVGALQE